MNDEVTGVRLQKYLAECGVSSRRGAEKMISDGMVSVNGSVVTRMGYMIKASDEVRVNGLPVLPEECKIYIIYHKRAGEGATVRDPEGRPTVFDNFRDFPVRLYPVGRLDYDSEGLLLLTNDGELTQRLLHPGYGVQKTYRALISNQLSAASLNALRGGVQIDGQLTLPAKVRVIKTDAFSTTLLMTIREGRNRQIRRMINAVGNDVVRLKRIQFGPIQLGKLERGAWRYLTDEEVAMLKNCVSTS